MNSIEEIHYTEQFLEFLGMEKPINPHVLVLNHRNLKHIQHIRFSSDLVRKTSLGKKLKAYSFFSCNIDEALHVGEDEKKTITRIVREIEKECAINDDAHSQDIIIANIDLLLSYCNRFYEMQYELGLPSARYCSET